MISVVVPISPIKSHPETKILDETIDSIRFHLPDTEIWLTFDGIRPEQEHRRQDYDEHIRRVLETARHWGAVVPTIFDQHSHQTGMLREILPEIKTPLLLYIEQDAPLVTDETIDWQHIIQFLTSGESNLVRFHHESVIPQPHRHLMHNTNDEFIETSQWSQRPHLATTAFYRRILDNCFPPDAKCFIEDTMCSVIECASNDYGQLGWNQYRLHIYAPPGNMKRSYHLDGRDGEPKWDDQ